MSHRPPGCVYSDNPHHVILDVALDSLQIDLDRKSVYHVLTSLQNLEYITLMYTSTFVSIDVC